VGHYKNKGEAKPHLAELSGKMSVEADFKAQTANNPIQ